MRSESTVIGIVAHVDAGKTTLSEQILFRTGVIRKAGRVDKGDTCFDYYNQERKRGITIFSKQTGFSYDGRSFTLIDTPGHVDFAAETERAVSVMDAAILVVDGVEGVQSQTEVWWELLSRNKIPTFIFAGKNDRDGADRAGVFENIKTLLGDCCFDFTTEEDERNSFEDIVALDEKWLELYFDGRAGSNITASAVEKRMAVPVVFGSSLTGDGVDRLLKLIEQYAPEKEYPDVFSASVYKISRDSSGDRVTFLKITGGELRVKGYVCGEKADQIRKYTGGRYEPVPYVKAGEVCGVMGLGGLYPGQIVSESAEPDNNENNKNNENNIFEFRPLIMSSAATDDCDNHTLVKYLSEISEEMPEMKVSVTNLNDDEQILVGVMGKIQMEIISEMLSEAHGINVRFGACRVMYRETIRNPVMGYGHYEPLRHYAEVHLNIEPTGPGTGITISNVCSLEQLDGNFQNLVLTHIGEKEHKGMLTGSPITDVKITLTAGRSHLKHTEGGDFREATYRAIRQGLEKADSILLEPFYSFKMRIPAEATGRAINDLQRMSCTFNAPEQESDTVIITGSGPVSELMNYSEDLVAYTGGRGVIICRNGGYKPCHNSDEVIEEIGYEKDRDLENPSSSVFCSHGAGFEVKWQDVDAMRHMK